MTRHAHKNSFLEVLPNTFIAHSFQLTESEMSVCKPVLCVIAQGGKDVFLNDELFHYGAGDYLISTLEMPIKSSVVQACEDKPYLNFLIGLDLNAVTDVMMKLPVVKPSNTIVKAMDVSPLDTNLLEVVVKLARLLDEPDDAAFLAPLIMREIIYRLLKGKQGTRLRQRIAVEGNTQRITRAVQHIRQHFECPLKVDVLAHQIGMSVSGFHQHFKSVTAMSPLQFQKQIRLQEARRLMLSDNIDVATASTRVGYDDPSYFSREYKKLFGTPPQRDIASLRSHISIT